MRFMMTISLILAATATAGAETTASKVSQHLRVAFVISDQFTMIDFAGPWEVFQDVVLPPSENAETSNDAAFELFTVSDATDPIRSVGGAIVVPSYNFETVPAPDIVVVGAQSSKSPALLKWLRKMNDEHKILVSICTGASKLALAGLLDNAPATTHHDFVVAFKTQFPRINWQASKRFVRSRENIYTGGGLTSGIDMALHIVAKRFGKDVAQTTANYMEYYSNAWTEED
jgi:transcriptional regulator GlxA family with amidase domain